ncbi:MAG TPA: DUF2911 domain-containing protein [Thermoanaerobaculia bacterium]|nr:DUF2911 domain-containing protein [Thermoanaerobaculia bacterium]
MRSRRPRSPAARPLLGGSLLAFSLLAFAAGGQEPAAVPPGEQAARSTETNELDGADVGRRRPTRGVTRLELAGAPVTVAYGLPESDGPEYREMESLAPGKVVRFFDAAAIKLSTEADLRFGELEIAAENVAPDYPGVYSLWLRRTSAGWELVFNEKADVWGTQYDPSADVGAVALRHTADQGPTAAFEAALEGAGNLGELQLSWGPHRWSVDFESAKPAP